MFIYDKYENKYYNTMGCSFLLQKMIDLITMSLWIRISGSHFSFRSLVGVGSSQCSWEEIENS